MKATYDPETDALYVRFSDTSVVESEEVSNGLVLDFDAGGKIVAFEFLDARKKLTPGAILTASTS